MIGQVRIDFDISVYKPSAHSLNQAYRTLTHQDIANHEFLLDQAPSTTNTQSDAVELLLLLTLSVWFRASSTKKVEVGLESSVLKPLALVGEFEGEVKVVDVPVGLYELVNFCKGRHQAGGVGDKTRGKTRQ